MLKFIKNQEKFLELDNDKIYSCAKANPFVVYRLRKKGQICGYGCCEHCTFSELEDLSDLLFEHCTF
jgi:hypothetical protein